MKKLNYIKFALDLAMGIIFAFLFNKQVLGGMKFHEIAGLAIGVAVLVHVLLNYKWVVNVSKSIFSKKVTLRTRLVYILNILLLIDMAIIIISGIGISKILFPNLGFYNSFLNQRTHISAAFIALTLIGIHLGLHWKWVINVFKKIIKLNKSNKAFGYLSKLAAVLVLTYGIYSMAAVNYVSKTVQIFSLGSSNQYEHDLEKREQNPKFQRINPKNNDSAASKQNNSASANNSINSSNDFQKDFEEKHQFQPENKGNFEGKEFGTVSAPSILATYLSIMGAFTVIAYYFEKMLLLRKSKA